MKKSVLLLIVVSVMMLCCLSANAATITDNSAFDWMQVNFEDQTVSVEKFNVPGARLTSVQVILNGAYWTGDGIVADNNPARIVNTHGASQDGVTYDMNANYYADLTGGVAGLASNFQFDDDSTFGTFQTLLHFEGDVAPNSTEFLGPALLTNGFDVTITDASDLATFVGPGAFAYQFDATALTMASGAGNLDTFINTWAKGSLGVVYTYENDTSPVPEPTTLILLGTGLIGLGIIGRRKFK